jgi:hypothetical protein
MQRPSVFHAVRVSVPLVIISALASCSAGSNDEPIGTVTQPLTNTECGSLALDVDRSLIVHDQATLSLADFSLRKTLKAIGSSVTTPEVLLKELIVSNSVVDRPQPVSGLILPLDSRPEAALQAEKLLDATNLQQHLRPIALINRLDLAPADGAYCGEHRIIYGRHQNGAAGRFFLIFEAALTNPHPELGIEGCRPVADFWASLSDSALFPTAASRAAALEHFYYSGLAGFEPVVKHSHYGSPFGQIRSNQFVNSGIWQLREWRAGFLGGAPALVVQPDGQTPLAQFYDSSFTPGPGEFSDMQPALFASERSAFQDDFLHEQIPHLAAPELGGTATTAFDIVNGVASDFPARFLEFQSDATAGTDNLIPKISTGFGSVIAGFTPAGLTVNDIAFRAEAVTCGGCHQSATGRKIGKLPDGTPVLWPSSAGFVHVTETGALSQALTQFFLPARAAVLKRAICPAQCEQPKKPRKSCCFADSQCAVGKYCAGEVCTAGGEGRCKAFVPAGQCWEDADCGDGGTCDGAILCPCGVDCIRADQPGQCASASFSALVTSKSGLAAEDATKPNASSIEEARAADRAQPGAFVPVRRSH